MKISVIAVTKEGENIANILGKHYDFKLYVKSEVKEKGLKNITEEAFKESNALIFISSTGIAVRAIAPFIKSKTVDPAVVVIDNSSKYVISLLSGHLGGANELTLDISNILKAMPIITTATDNLGIEAPDIVAKKNNLVIEDMKKCKDIAGDLVEGVKVGFLDIDEIIGIPKGYVDAKEEEVNSVIVVGNKKDYGSYEKNNTLKLIRKNVVLGIGCRKDYDSEKMRDFVLATLDKLNIHEKSIVNIGTVEVKKNEKAIIDLSKYLNCELKIFTIEEIKKIHHRYKGSDFVEKTIGVRCVSEPSVELSGGELIVTKLTHEGMTLSIGEIRE